MKTTTTNLKSVVLWNLLSEWLKTENVRMSQIVGQPLSNLSFIGTLAFSIFATLSLIFASAFFEFYGWAAFFALASLNCAQPLFHEIKKGGI